MSMQDDVDRKHAIEPSDLVRSLSLLASPASSSQIGLRKENELSDQKENPEAGEHDIFVDRFLALRLVESLIDAIRKECAPSENCQEYLNGLDDGCSLIRDFFVEDGNYFGIDDHKLHNDVEEHFQLVGQEGGTRLAALKEGFKYGTVLDPDRR